MKAFSITDIGKKRSINQDYLFCSEEPVGSFPNLFVIADGMGGHRAGDYASRLCVTKVVEALENTKCTTTVSKFKEAIEYANRVVYGEANSNEAYEGMGTTMVAAVLEEDNLYIANIGDSRLYKIGATLKQITEDHSLVEEMVKKGELEKNAARSHPNKNIITRAVGTNQTVEADYFEIKASPGDIFLLCSDGLSNMVEDDEIEAIIKSYKGDISGAGKKLIQKANEYGGRDNIAIILVEI